LAVLLLDNVAKSCPESSMVIFPSYILTSSKESLFDVILSPGVPIECIDNDPVIV
jgi:hypothetical protein